MYYRSGLTMGYYSIRYLPSVPTLNPGAPPPCISSDLNVDSAVSLQSWHTVSRSHHGLSEDQGTLTVTIDRLTCHDVIPSRGNFSVHIKRICICPMYAWHHPNKFLPAVHGPASQTLRISFLVAQQYKLTARNSAIFTQTTSHHNTLTTQQDDRQDQGTQAEGCRTFLRRLCCI